jgi:hypothetical protein
MNIRNNFNYAMNMVGHYNKFAQRNVRKMVGDILPIQRCLHTNIRQQHKVIFNIPKVAFPIAGANGYKVEPFGCIGIVLQPNMFSILHHNAYNFN